MSIPILKLKQKPIRELAIQALSQGWVDDYEVIEYLNENYMIAGLKRIDPNGEVLFSPEEISMAIKHKIEIRPVDEITQLINNCAK